MRTRMDKYYNDEEILQRTSKNDSLYDKLYKEKQVLRSNVTVIDNINEIDLSKIKSIVNNREDYKKIRNYENAINNTEFEKKEEINYDFDEVDNSNYDINEILKRKRSNKNYENSSKIRKIDEEFCEDTFKNYKNLSDDFLNHEQQLKELFNTVTQTNAVESTDLFANLKENSDEDKSFYTNTSKFEGKDFENDFKEIEEKKVNVFLIIILIAIIISIGIICYIKFFK